MKILFQIRSHSQVQGLGLEYILLGDTAQSPNTGSIKVFGNMNEETHGTNQQVVEFTAKRYVSWNISAKIVESHAHAGVTWEQKTWVKAKETGRRERSLEPPQGWKWS